MALVEINWNPDRRQLRTFAILWLIAFGLLGAYVAWKAGALAGRVPIGWRAPWTASLALWLLAVAGSVTGLALPTIIKPVYIAWMVAAFPVGWMVSQVLLALTYFGVFTACALVFRLIGRDPLHRSFDQNARTYWVPHSSPSEVGRYFRQF